MNSELSIHDRRILRAQIFERDNKQCQYCGDMLDFSQKNGFLAPTVDHIIPKSQGGEDSYTNLIACCNWCNTQKGTKSYEEFVAMKPWTMVKGRTYKKKKINRYIKRGRKILDQQQDTPITYQDWLASIPYAYRAMVNEILFGLT